MATPESISVSDILHPQLRGAMRAARRAISNPALALPSLLALCDQGAVSVTNFATAVMIGRVCGKAELGVYSLAWTLITIATGVISTLISAPYTVFAPQLKSSRRTLYLGSLLVHQVLLSVSCALIICVVAVEGKWQGWLSGSNANVGTITAAVIVFISIREFIRSVSFAELRVGWALSVDLTACVAQLVGIALLVHWGGLTASRTYTILGISSGLAASGWLLIHRSTFRLDKRFYRADLKRNWDFGKWILGSGLLWQASAYMFPWIIAIFRGNSITGVWAACAAIVALGNPVLLGLSNYVLPKISNVYATAGVQSMKHHVHRYSLLFVALLLPVVLFMALFGERLLIAIYGGEFGGTGRILVLLALNLLVVTLAKPYAQGLFSLKCARSDTLVNLIWVALLMALGVPAVRSYALTGAASTMLASSSVAVTLKIAVFAREARRSSICVAKPPVVDVASAVTCDQD